MQQVQGTIYDLSHSLLEGIRKQQDDYIMQRLAHSGGTWYAVCDCGHTVPREESRVVLMEMDVDANIIDGKPEFTASQPCGLICAACVEKYIESESARAARRLMQGDGIRKGGGCVLTTVEVRTIKEVKKCDAM